MAAKKYEGGCHCGAVRFECEVNLAAGTSRCNCSICAKSRFWKTIVKADAFQLLAGDEALASYQFGSGMITHRSCRHCGVKTFGQGHLEELGAFYAVNILCLDGIPDQELAAAPVIFEDGRSNHWERPPAVTAYL